MCINNSSRPISLRSVVWVEFFPDSPMTLVGTLNVISKFWSGGIGQYANRAGKSNIEFEAKVITDLIQLKKRRELYRGESKVLVEDISMMIPTANYNKFLRSIRNGKMKNEDYTKLLNDFSKYAKNIEYRNNVNTNLIPLIINNYGSKFTSDKCGTND